MSLIDNIENKQVRDFAIACYNDCSIEELEVAYNDVDKTDCETWVINEDGYKQAIYAALSELKLDRDVRGADNV